MQRHCATMLALLAALLAAAAAAATNSDDGVSLNWRPSPPTAGRPATLTATLHAPGGRALAPRDFAVSHEQLAHLVGVGADMDTFFHVHPDAPAAGASAFTFSGLVLPKAGRYGLALDGQPKGGGAPAAEHARVDVAGAPAMAAPSRVLDARRGVRELLLASTPLVPASAGRRQPAVSLASLLRGAGASSGAGQQQPAYRARLSGPAGRDCKPGTPATFTWTLAHAGSGAPVTDLNHYYGAPMHLAVAKSDLSVLQHVHGEAGPATSGDGGGGSSGGHANHAGLRRRLQQAAGHAGHASPGAGTEAAGGDSTMPGGGNAGGGNTGNAGGNHGMGMGMMSMPSSGAGGAGGHSMATDAMPTPTSGGGVGGHGSHGGHAAPARFGPALRATVTFPSPGTYLLVAQLARRGELVLLPFVVSCTGA